jgi:hypothetical protein
MGFWQVDYPLTSYTFWNMMVRYTPIAVMTTSRAADDKIWLLEIGSTNLPQDAWAIAPWNTGRPPYIGGSNIDPAAGPGLPNAGRAPGAGSPPDATRAALTALRATPAVIGPRGLQIRIITILNRSIPAADLTAQQAPGVQGTAPDNYVSAFAGYHAVWYLRWNATCKAGWHTHVGSQITPATATTAIRLQLLELIAWLNNRP